MELVPIAEWDFQADYAAMIDASPNGGSVTDADLERAAEAAWAVAIGVTPWEDLGPDGRAFLIAQQRAALAALGLALSFTAHADRRVTMSAIDDIAAERRRQIEIEGWTPEHDDDHADGALARAAACYAVGDRQERFQTRLGQPVMVRTLWPWQIEWWKPTDRRRDLVKAGALIVAEIERLDRAPKSTSAATEEGR